MNKTLINFLVDDSLLRRIEDFRFKNRFATRAAAIKWLLDWALKQKPSVQNLVREPEESHPVEVASVQPPIQSLPAEAAKPERVTVASRDSMVQALRDQGYEVSEAARQPRRPGTDTGPFAQPVSMGECSSGASRLGGFPHDAGRAIRQACGGKINPQNPRAGVALLQASPFAIPLSRRYQKEPFEDGFSQALYPLGRPREKTATILLLGAQ